MSNSSEQQSYWWKLGAGEFALMSKKELWTTLLIALSIFGAILWTVFSIIEPPPPKKIKLLTGSSSGAYFAFGKAYDAAFKKHGISVEVVQSAGSVENLNKMLVKDSEFHAAFIQSGIASSAQTLPSAEGEPPQLETLASVSFEPVWIFYRPTNSKPAEAINSLTWFSGKKLGVGPDGSGSRVVATKLLSNVQLGKKELTLDSTSGIDAVNKVIDGSLDGALLVAGVSAASVQKALNSGLRAISLERADAYARLYPWLTKITLPRGVVNMNNDLPAEDVTLLAATANLVTQKDLHPAIAYLLMDVATEVHRNATILNGLKEFPSEKSLDFPQSDESKRYFKQGRPFLQRYLPFWLANLAERALLTLVPLLAVLIPAIQLIPKLFMWFGKSRILKMYDQVRLVERAFLANPGTRGEGLMSLKKIEEQLTSLPPDSDLFVDIYNLRGHIDHTRSRLGAT